MSASPIAVFLFFSTQPATTDIYTLSLHDALPIFLRRHMQRAERAGGYGDRLPAHHMRAAALSGPIKGGGALSPLLAHHPGHLTGDPHGRLPAHLEEQRARPLERGRATAGEALHTPALA